MVWLKDGVPQCEGEDTKNDQDAEDADDRYIEQVMADAMVAQNKRDRASKQAWSRS